MTAYRPTADEVAELRAAVLYRYQAGEPNPDAITSDWVRGIVSQPDGGLVDVIDALAREGGRVPARIVGYAVAQHPGPGLPPCIEDVHPTREGAEDEARAMRDAASFSEDYRVYEVREVSG